MLVFIKKYLVALLLITLCVGGLFAQDPSKVESYKIGFFSEKLELTPQESERFWPLYNKYRDEIKSIKKNSRQSTRQIGLMSDSELNEVFQNFLSNKEKEVAAARKLHADLKKVLSERKATLVFFVEREFNNKLLQTMRKNNRGN